MQNCNTIFGLHEYVAPENEILSKIWPNLAPFQVVKSSFLRVAECGGIVGLVAVKMAEFENFVAESRKNNLVTLLVVVDKIVAVTQLIQRWQVNYVM